MRAHVSTLVLALLAMLALPASAQLTRQAGNINLPPTLPSSSTFTSENALGSLTFSNPLDLAAPPGVANRLFVLERAGVIQMVNLDTMAKSPFMDLATFLTAQSRPITTSGECGLLSMAFHPNYNQNGYFYLFYSLNIGSVLHQRVARFTATGTPGSYNSATTANANTEAPLITQRDVADNHNGGDMAFGPDGYLYISVGDGGPQHDGADNGRRIAKNFFGAILRLDVDAKPGSLAPNPHDESTTSTVGDSAITPNSYRVPPDNPFVSLAQGGGNATYNGFTFARTAIRTEIYSTGYRNPYRFSFDPLTGRLFGGEVGQDTYEEVDIVTNGFNAGWSWREGFHDHTPAQPPSTAPVGFLGAPPIFEFDHSDNGVGNDAIIYGSAIIGGVVYRGDRLPELFGKYVFSDYSNGIVAALTEQPNGTWTGARIGTAFGSISGWGYDPRNNDALFCTGSNMGTVRRLTRTTSGTNPPATLSATGAFSNLATLTPSTGVVPYAPNVSFWSDYAIKSRWFTIENLTDTVPFSANGSWTLPTGMIWIKHFDIETTRGNPATRRKLETRFLVKTAEDVYGITYKWRADQTDADLVAESGLTEAIPNSIPAQTWRYPSRTECHVCHTPAGGFALSFNTRQLNRTNTYGAQTLNQIAALSQAGYLTGLTTPVNTLPAFVPPTDTTASLEARVRSYLAVNCVQCHQPGGATPGLWDARITTATDAANLINGTLINDGGDPTNRWAVPNDPAHSMVLKRLQGAGVQRMPPLATNERDLVAEQLLTDWIASLADRQSFTQWQATQFNSIGGPGVPNAQPDADPDLDGLTNRGEYLLARNPLVLDLPFLPTTTDTGNDITINFQHPANRSVVVETSTNLTAWSLWDVPGNRPFFPATTQSRSLSGPKDNVMRAFRLRLSEQ